MSFQVSPGVKVTEIDLTTIVPAISTTEGAIGGVFHWGPVEKPLLIDSEEKLAVRYGKPSNFNAETFYTGANFLAYGNKLYVNRTIDGALNAIANNDTVATAADQLIKNEDTFETQTFGDDIQFSAKYPGDIGNSLAINIIAAADGNLANVSAYSSTLLKNDDATYWSLLSNPPTTPGSITDSGLTIDTGNANGFFQIVGAGSFGGAADANNTINSATASLEVGSIITIGNSSIGTQNLTIKTLSTAQNGATGLAEKAVTFEEKFRLGTTSSIDLPLTANWKYYTATETAPAQSDYQENFGSAVNDEVTIVISDEDGKITGVPGTILEVFEKLSRATDAKTEDGASNYWKTVVNNGSAYVWAINEPAELLGNTAINLTSVTDQTYSSSFNHGVDGNDEASCSISSLITGYEPYRNAEDIDISLILAGKARNEGQMAQWLIDNVAEYRMDCVVFASPDKTDVVQNIFGDQSQDIVDFRNTMGSSSYGILDSGYKYQYDKYNDIYRWIPLNGDIAGLAVRTDETRDPWYSPAGFNRGQIKNIIKLAFNPESAERDLLYKNGVNPVVTFPGQGTVLFGDKTLLSKPSAFDRINVRRLFIVLEKAIATAAKFSLFEFNDEFTRAQFVSIVEPFLRDVQGRRGIFDFKVVCDESNNTPEIIDRNEFVGDIYIKPARSINFIQLNFIAVRTGVSMRLKVKLYWTVLDQRCSK
jgi:hypothetical protein